MKKIIAVAVLVLISSFAQAGQWKKANIDGALFLPADPAPTPVPDVPDPVNTQVRFKTTIQATINQCGKVQRCIMVNGDVLPLQSRRYYTDYEIGDVANVPVYFYRVSPLDYRFYVNEIDQAF